MARGGGAAAHLPIWGRGGYPPVYTGRGPEEASERDLSLAGVMRASMFKAPRAARFEGVVLCTGEEAVPGPFLSVTRRCSAWMFQHCGRRVGPERQGEGGRR